MAACSSRYVFFGDALYELDPNLQKPPRLIAENLGWINGMDWGPDGFLYGPVTTGDQVVRMRVDGDFQMETVADGFGAPGAVKFDSQGRLHVVDSVGEVVRVDTVTGEKTVLATNLPRLDNLAFDSHDHLFVSSDANGDIVQILPRGGTRTVSEGGMIAPGGGGSIAPISWW